MISYLIRRWSGTNSSALPTRHTRSASFIGASRNATHTVLRLLDRVNRSALAALRSGQVAQLRDAVQRGHRGAHHRDREHRAAALAQAHP